MNNKITKAFFIISLFALSIFLGACSKNDEPGKFDAFATCLTEKGVIMYGTEWCPHCQNQKKLFGSSFDYINYIDCDRNQQACAEAGITGYPTWFVGGEYYPGEQSFYDLATRSGCSITAPVVAETQ
jgi:hypothetical protein